MVKHRMSSRGRRVAFGVVAVLLFGALAPRVAMAAPPAAPLPGATSLDLNFANTYPGTISDANGNGTGFTTVMANTAGNQYNASLVNLDNTHGVLDITSTSGTMTARANTQINALGTAFDAGQQKFTITSRLAGPFTEIDLARDHQALWFGPDQDDFFKVEVENNGGTPGLVVFFEQTNGVKLPNKIIAGPISPPGLANAAFVDLFLTCDPATGSCTFAYRIASDNPSDITPIGTSAKPKFPATWFTANALAGVLVSDQLGTVSFTGKFETFAVTAPITPTASLVASRKSGKSPLAVTFNGSGSSDPIDVITSWTLDFGDATPRVTGTGSPSSAVAHTYTAAGVYKATLTVTASSGLTDTATAKVRAK